LGQRCLTQLAGVPFERPPGARGRLLERLAHAL